MLSAAATAVGRSAAAAYAKNCWSDSGLLFLFPTSNDCDCESGFFLLFFSLSFCCTHTWLLRIFGFLLIFNQGITAQDQQSRPPPLVEVPPQLKLKVIGPATKNVWFCVDLQPQ